MAYIGRNPAIGTQKVLDSLESQFNGSLTTFDLRYNSNTIYPNIASALIVSLGGVLQEPGTAYTVASDQIVFASAPPTGTDCWILLYSEFGAIAGASTNLTIGNNLTVQGLTDLDGNIDIDAGQITYTASSNIAKFSDDAKLIFGDGDDLQIYHTADTESVIHDNGTGPLNIRTNNLQIKNSANGTTMAEFLSGTNGVSLYYNNSKKFETTSTGVSVTGTSSATTLSTGASGTGVNISTNTISGPATLTIDPAAVGDDTGTVEIKGNLTVQGTTTTINSTTVDLDHLSLGDSEKAFFGSDNDLEIFHNGSGSFIRQIGTGNLFITALTDAADISINSDDGSGGTCTYIKADGSNGKVKLFHYGTEKLQTTTNGVTVSGTVAADGLSIGDNEIANFGDGNDLQIYHDGSNSAIQNLTGYLYLYGGTNNIYLRAKNDEDGIVVKPNDSVELYYNNSKKFETTSTGVNVTGALEVSAATNITVGGTALPSLTGLLGGSLRGTLGAVTMHMTSSDPGSPVQGQFYFNSLDQKAKIYTGSSFVDLVPAGSGGGGGGGGSSSDANATFRKYTYSISSTTNSVTGSSDIVTDAGEFITGLKYTIKSVGTTDFTAIGASANSVGTVFTATGAGSGDGEAFDTLIYSTGGDQNVEVYVNGVKAVEGSSNDYVATNGSSVNFVANLASGDVVDIQVYELLTNDAFVLATGGTFSGNVGINTASVNNRLHIHSSGNDEGILLTQQGSNYNGIIASADRNAVDNYILNLQANWNGNGVARIAFETGDDTTNKDDGRIKFFTSSSGSNPTVRMNISPTGNVAIGFAENTNADAKLQVKGEGNLGGTAPHKYKYSTNSGIKVYGAESAVDIVGEDNGDHSASLLVRAGGEGFGFLNDPNKDALHIRSFTTSADDFYIHSAGSQISSLKNIASFTKEGQVLIGPQAARVVTTTVKPAFQVEGTTFHESALSITRNTADAHPPYLILAKSRSASLGGNVILVDEDKLGEIRFGGSDGVDMANFGAEIRAEIDGTPAADSIPGALVFSTSPGDGPAEALRIDSSRNVGIGTDNPGVLLDLYRATNTSSSSTGTTLLRITNDVGNDISQQKSFIDFSFLDDNSNEIPQVRIGAEVGTNVDANSHTLEGSGAFVVYTNNADTDGASDTAAGASLAERMRVDHSGNVGIGTNNPGNSLHVYSNSTQSGPNTHSPAGAVLQVQDNSNSLYIDGNSIIGTGSGTLHVGNASNTAMNLWTNGNNRVHIEAGGDVGIGTASPRDPVHIFHPTNNVNLLIESGDVNAYLAFRDNTTTSDTSVYLGAEGNNLKFITSGAERVRIESGGNVGIGTDNPGTKLEVNGEIRIHQRTAAVPARMTFKSAASNQSPTARIEFWEGNSVGATGESHAFIEYDGAPVRSDGDTSNPGSLLIKGLNDNGSNQVFAGFTRKNITYFNSKVGIDTDIPGAKLHINGGATNYTPNSSGTELFKVTGGASSQYSMFIGIDNVGGYFGHNGSGRKLFFQTNESTRVTIDASGNVGIGTVTPAAKLDIYGGTDALWLHKTSNAGGVGIAFSDHAGSNPAYQQQGYLRFLHSDGASFGHNAAFAFTTTETEAPTNGSFTVYSSDDFTAVGTLTENYSDERLKTIHGRIDNPLEKLSKIHGYYYTQNETADELGFKEKGQRQVGVSAQEIQEVLPEVIRVAPISYTDKTDEEYYTVQYNRVVPLLIESIKAQQELIEKLQQRLDDAGL